MSAEAPRDVAISAEERNRAAIALAEAMGRAREQLTVRDTMRTDARVNAQQRLEMLRLKLAPVFDAIPRDAEQFNLGVVTAEKPRLYIDIIGYVEMTSHLKGYRLMQETRRGIQAIAESSDEAGIMATVTDYIARRLVDRERALAGASPVPPLTSVAPAQANASVAAPAMPVTTGTTPAGTSPAGIVATAREALVTAPVVVDETTRATPVIQAATQAAEQVKLRAAGLMESARQAMSAPPEASRPDLAEAAPAAPPSGSWRAGTPVAAATVAAATGAALSARSNGSGGWVWALLSLFIGIGIGAALLYFYAASLGRP